jgi:hypothetical protein
MTGRGWTSGSRLLCLLGLCGYAPAQTALPALDVVRPTPTQRPARVARKPSPRRSWCGARTALRPAPLARGAPAAADPTKPFPGSTAIQATRMEEARTNILARRRQRKRGKSIVATVR